MVLLSRCCSLGGGCSPVEIVRPVATDISWRTSYLRFIMGMCVVQLTHVITKERALCFQKYNWMSLVTGLLLIAAAIYMFANPAIPLVFWVMCSPFRCGLVAFEAGPLLRRAKQVRTGWDLVDGILTVVAGLILLTASVGE